MRLTTIFTPVQKAITALAIMLVFSACSSLPFGGESTGVEVEVPSGDHIAVEQRKRRQIFGGGRGSIEDNVQVNKYIWNAALDVLSFLPVKSADPFTGVILTDFGTVPGGTQSYRAVIHVTDPALDARALNLSLMTRNGIASEATVLAVEDAILTRAQQLRTGE